MSEVLNRTVSAFNNRNFIGAGKLAAEGLASAQGRDELFWMGLLETCEGYDALMRKDMLEAERKLIAAMQKLRNFGFRYRNFEVAVALAGIRLAVEHIRLVQGGKHKVFDVSLHPTLRLAAKADD